MVDDFATAPLGSVIVAAVMDEASNKLSEEAKAIFTGMGSKEITALGFREGYFFIGMKGSKQHLEKRGTQVSGGLILGYSRVVKHEKKTKTVTQTKSWKRTIKRVYKKKVVTTDSNGNKTTKIVTRVASRTVTCKSSRKTTNTSSKTTMS